MITDVLAVILSSPINLAFVFLFLGKTFLFFKIKSLPILSSVVESSLSSKLVAIHLS